VFGSETLTTKSINLNKINTTLKQEIKETQNTEMDNQNIQDRVKTNKS